MSLTLETAIIAITQVQVAYNCSDLEAISKIQAEAAKAGDEESIEVLFVIKNELIKQLLNDA